MKRFIFVSIALVLIGTGCAWFQTKTEKNADELANEGMQAFQKKDYRDAIAAFQKLKDWYPFSKYAILAELKIADSHCYLEQYDEAIAFYESFENLHPRNEAVPYVIYQIGRCYFEQIDTVDRDQTATRKALDIFSRLIRQYSDNEYALKARGHVKKCHENLAGHEFYVGLYYYKNSHYKSALNRFEAVLNYSEAGEVIKKAREYIELCKKKGA